MVQLLPQEIILSLPHCIIRRISTSLLGNKTGIVSAHDMQKRIGTLVPLSALFSSQLSPADAGTFAAGLIFLDWLKKTHQSAWQLLPLHETQLEPGSITKRVPSPYKNYGIGLDPKYLSRNAAQVHPTEMEKEHFIRDTSEWIHDYALFCALTDHFHTDDWRTWDADFRNRDTQTLAHWEDQHVKEIDHHIVIQWQLYTTYSKLRKKAKEYDITLIGDLPFYPSLHSPLVWAHQDIFQIEKDGSMKNVSGIPDTVGAHFGRQVWGHALYNWQIPETVLTFWKMRLRYQATLFDRIRFDHAKGIFAYGVMSVEDTQYDRYEEGPGSVIFKELIAFCRSIGLSVFAEDNGDRTELLRKNLHELTIPGIKIYRFSLKKDADSINEKYAAVSQYPPNCVAYTTTHDTETLLGYLRTLTSEQKLLLAKASHITYDSDDIVFAQTVRNAIIASPAKTVIIPIQDWLLITDRINVPGTELPRNDPNWNFQVKIPVEDLPYIL